MSEGVRSTAEYAAAWTLLKTFGWMPRWMAYPAAKLIAWTGFHFAGRQRRVGFRNLEMALPELQRYEHHDILCGSFENLGRLLVEFSHFPDLTRENIGKLVQYDGFEHFEAARARGKGVLFLTAHLGAWELSSFAHSVYGHPMKFLVRKIDNPRVERLISSYRQLAGNVPILRTNSARDILKALRANETVGILIDQNASDGVFADFFGMPAATTTALATLAIRTGAAVIPGFLIWDHDRRIHRLSFKAPLQLIEAADAATAIFENTRLFNAVVEEVVREHPDQWLWIHRRWKTRPAGGPPLYD